MEKFEMKLEVRGTPGNRMGTFMELLKDWIDKHDKLSYEDVEGYTIKVLYDELGAKGRALQKFGELSRNDQMTFIDRLGKVGKE